MKDTPPRPTMVSVRCALCGHPVSQMARQTGALAGGMCTRESCVKDDRDPKKRRQVYTFNRLVDDVC